jgi:hypothetical protein
MITETKPISARQRLHAFEDRHLPNVPRVKDGDGVHRSERGHGSLFSRLAPEVREKFELHDRLIAAEDAEAGARLDVSAAQERLQAATAAHKVALREVERA